ncbi:hypothetical protein LTR37_014348 [Vermiconidia calcicola]|uniref:Uncharacterized protein n=1 Tax=Vermiconidia calcicola TaxID=1690605 RepID=A0ACC3MTY8_9PEZI|nr:hypothetical protein LTR37_014348 [Vermiconidia calcicola]
MVRSTIIWMNGLRDRATDNLSLAGVAAADVQYFKTLCTVLEYVRHPNHCGGIVRPQGSGPEVRTLANGKTFTWEDVPLIEVIKHAESFVKDKVEEPRRTEVWRQMFHGLPMRMKRASWEKASSNLREHPETPYSQSTAAKPKSNGELIESLGSVAALERRKIEIFKTQIVFRDSVSSEGTSGAMSIRDGIGTVYGGRLGRDHTLADVPNHFPSRKNFGEARNLLKLEQALEAIECEDIDLTARERVSYRDFDMVEPIFASCVKPNQNQTEEEKDLEISTSIDRDCDQVRAMIARLVRYSDEWTVDAFRKALGGEKRAALIKFLERKGPRECIKLRIYQEAWEFFHRRELLGIPLPCSTLPEESKKRRREPLEERAVNTLEKSADERKTVAKEAAKRRKLEAS